MVLALALLAGIKVWVQDTVFRAAAEEALIAAYRDRAVAACQRGPQGDPQGRSLAPPSLDWSHPSQVRLVIGNSGIGVHIWEIDHELWDARYKKPYLVLSSGRGVDCAFDIGQGTALVSRT
jgi:hypothetical protein